MPEPTNATAEPQAAGAQPEPKSVTGLSALEAALQPMVDAASNGSQSEPPAPTGEAASAGAVTAGETPAESLKPDAAPVADTPAAEEPKPGEPPRPSRRQEEEERRQAEIRQAIEQYEREKQAREAAEKTAAAAQAKASEYEAQALQALGDDAEFTRLMSVRMDGRRKGEFLSPDEDDRLDAMIQTRQLAKAYMEIATRNTQTAHLQAVRPLADKLGIDAEFLGKQPDVPALLEHAVSTTEARVRAELDPQITERDQRIADLEAEMDSLRARSVGRSRPLVAQNGQSSTAIPGTGDYDNSRTPQENLREYFAGKVGAAS